MKKCKKCGAPLEGFLYNTIGKLMGIKPSAGDPEICNKCEADKSEPDQTAESAPIMPAEEKSEMPAEESTVIPEEEKPEMPAEESTVIPEEEKPEMSAEEPKTEETEEKKEDIIS